ncbi:hypothetical protein [Miltoncostaea marina]|uniref:hypothetical protein n=1 Tax=Miltoncostaea marina TaxID=2843215 RepID=UPI001C3D8F78|nr:hypothetical protein [Miltoncostaea marina]
MRRPPPPAAAARGGATLRPAGARSVRPVVAAGAARAAALPGLAAPARGASRLVPAPARRAPALVGAARRERPIRRAAARAPGAARAVLLRVQRRERVPWAVLPRERLARAWAGVCRDHDAGELRLVGVYGPLPLAAVESVALDADGRLAVALRPRAAGAPGDIAVARREPGGALVRCDVPYPAPARSRRGLR